MAARESELPAKGPRPGAASGRPIPLPAAANGQSNSAAHANRPIPLAGRNSQSLPEHYEEVDDDEKDDLHEILRNAPAWLVSTVFHTVLLIVLGLLAVTAHSQSTKMEIEMADPQQYAEQLGDQLTDPTGLVGDSTQLDSSAKQQLITPTDMTAVEDPFAAPPNLGELNLGAAPSGAALASSHYTGAPIGLALSGRQIGTRNVLIGKYGGTALTEDAVVRGLEWLIKNQKADGSWSLKGPFSDASMSENVEAATAMALLAFQGHGDTHRTGKYAKNVQRAWAALLKLQTKEGAFGTHAVDISQQLYTHAQCTIALCELYGMTNDSMYRGSAERAIAYAVSAQDPERGGWRYRPRYQSDTSVTGWFVMALQSARMAHMKVPQASLDRVSRYLDSVQIKDGREYGYWEAARATVAMNAEGLLCRQYLGWKQDDPRMVEGATALNSVPVQYGTGRDVYYWYYATQVTHHMGGKIWDDWNKVMRQKVPERQVKTGPQAGSWDPQGDPWAEQAGGRLYITCLSIYMLEVYYRHLPIYSGYRYVPEAADPADQAPADPTAAVDGKAKDVSAAAPGSSEAVPGDTNEPGETKKADR